jgi:hypothetical protein
MEGGSYYNPSHYIRPVPQEVSCLTVLLLPDR